MRRALSLASAAALALALALPPAAAAFSDTGQCQGFLVSSGTMELRPGYWTVGEHNLRINFYAPGMDEVWGPFDFSVSADAPLYPGQVWVAAGLLTTDMQEVPDRVINPAQDTVVWSAWMWDMTGVWGGEPYTMQQAKADNASGGISFSIDDGPWLPARQGPITSACATGLFQLISGEPLGNSMFRHSFGSYH